MAHKSANYTGKGCDWYDKVTENPQQQQAGSERIPKTSDTIPNVFPGSVGAGTGALMYVLGAVGLEKFAPQAVQKLELSGISTPQFGQIIFFSPL